MRVVWATGLLLVVAGCRQLGVPCVAVEDCGLGEVCVDGACVVACNVDSDCAAGEVCTAGLCAGEGVGEREGEGEGEGEGEPDPCDGRDPFGNDINGDCIPDLVVGAPGTSRLLLIRGPDDGVFDNNPPHQAQVVFNNNGGRLGAAIAVAPRRQADGRRFVYFSRPDAAEILRAVVSADFTTTTQSVLVSRTSGTTGLGSAVAVADAGDGLGILLASEPTAAGTPVAGGLLAGTVQALVDGVLSLVRTIVPADLGNASAGIFASRIHRVDDVDADGVEDFIVGSPGLVVGGQNIGAFFVSGATRGITGTSIVAPAQGRASFGAEVVVLGDVDGDGVDDLAFGAPDDGSRGRVFLRLSTTPATLRTIEPPSLVVSANARFGAAIAGVGDIDGDGRNEIVIGAPMDSLTSNAVASCAAFDVGSRASGGDCAGGVYIVPSTRLADATAFPCSFPNTGRASRYGSSLRALGPSLDPALALNHQRFAVGAPGVTDNAPETAADDRIGTIEVRTITWNDATTTCAGNVDRINLDVGAGTLLGESLAH